MLQWSVGPVRPLSRDYAIRQRIILWDRCCSSPKATECWHVTYCATALTPTEQRYAQTEKEALVVTWACEHFQHYLLWLRFTIETDHKPLVPLLWASTKFPFKSSVYVWDWWDTAIQLFMCQEQQCSSQLRNKGGGGYNIKAFLWFYWQHQRKLSKKVGVGRPAFPL